jgi:hypothetical protein
MSHRELDTDAPLIKIRRLSCCSTRKARIVRVDLDSKLDQSALPYIADTIKADSTINIQPIPLSKRSDKFLSIFQHPNNSLNHAN